MEKMKALEEKEAEEEEEEEEEEKKEEEKERRVRSRRGRRARAYFLACFHGAGSGMGIATGTLFLPRRPELSAASCMAALDAYSGAV